jgi:hypothetical protein
MRTIFLVSMAIVSFPPAAATARMLPPGIPAASFAVGSPDSPVIAALSAPGQLVVRSPGQATQAFAIRDACGPAAVAPGVVFMCTGGTPEALSLATGALSPVPIGQLTPGPDYEHFRLLRAGTHWLEGQVDLTSETSPSPLTVPVIVSRSTGQTIDLRGVGRGHSLGARRYVDLSSARPDRALCAPVRRSHVPGIRPKVFARLLKVGNWTLRASGDELVSFLQRCGSRRSQRLSVEHAPILGRGYAAWFDGRVIRLRHLRTGRDQTFTWFRPGFGRDDTTMAFTSNRLLVSQRTGTGPGFLIHTIRLR